jgi:hypothetical protein
MPTVLWKRSHAARPLLAVAIIVGVAAPLRSLSAQLVDQAGVRPLAATDSAFAAGAARQPKKTFFTRKDAIWSGAVFAGSAILSGFDVRIANWFQSSSVQSESRNDLAHSLTTFNEQPLAILTVGGYAIGKLSHSELVADVAGHSAEALAMAVVLSEAIRVPLGRSRPRTSPDDQYNFDFMAGWSEFDRRSFPSIHAAAAYSVASALVGEIKIRNPSATKWAAPVLYTAAAIPGLTRMYLNQHWASDVLSGTFVGVLLGSRVVSYAHSHHNKVDRILGIAMLVPDGQGGSVLVMSRPTDFLAR